MALVTIDDAAENAFIASKLTAPSYIGLTDGGAEGVWRWDDHRIAWCGDDGGVPLDSVSFTSWGAGSPERANCERGELGGSG